MYVPTAKSYFSGAGLMDIGMMQAGVNIIQSLDIDKNAIESMRRNSHYFSHKIETRNIAGITVKEQVKSDVHIYTYPCTKYSAIADIHGARTGDELYLHAFRHMAIEQPDVFVAENVPGMRKFKVVMEAMTQLPGYYITTFCPVDASLWLPQKRPRLIIIGTRKPFTISAPTNKKRVQLKDILESDPVVDFPAYVMNRINGKYRDKPIIVDPETHDVCAPTCVAHYSKDLGTRLVKDRKAKYGVRPFSIREYARLQGVPDDYIFPEERASYSLIGNGVAVPKARWIGETIMKYFN